MNGSGKARPVGAESVILRLPPGDVRAEARLPSQIEGEVNTQASGLRKGVHQARRGRLPAVAEVMSRRIKGPFHPIEDVPSQGEGAKARGIKAPSGVSSENSTVSLTVFVSRRKEATAEQ